LIDLRKNIKILISDPKTQEGVKVMLLYHVRFDLYNTGRKFEPRVPRTGMVGEDKQTPRISTSSSLEGALSGCPSGAARLHNSKMIQAGLLRVFVIDTEKLGITKILEPSELLDKGVWDAEITQEYWILEPVEVPEEDVLLIIVDSYRVEEVSLLQGPPETISGIKGLKLISPLLKEEGVTISLYNSLAADKLKTHLEEFYKVKEFQEVKDQEGVVKFIPTMGMSTHLLPRRIESILKSTERFEFNSLRLSFIFNNPFQIREIEKGVKSGVNVKLLMNPQLDVNQMTQIRLGLESNLDVHKYAREDIHWQTMHVIKKGMEQGLDMDDCINPEFGYGDVEDKIKEKKASLSRGESKLF
jgi:hypothetical protein